MNLGAGSNLPLIFISTGGFNHAMELAIGRCAGFELWDYHAGLRGVLCAGANAVITGGASALPFFI